MVLGGVNVQNKRILCIFVKSYIENGKTDKKVIGGTFFEDCGPEKSVKTKFVPPTDICLESAFKVCTRKFSTVLAFSANQRKKLERF
mmetsp:Transcript_16741/g.22126  ORF Transcript_16741/g.22126 Transcript_16741/m.22126 type:complete len:87 (-) Transcript_16741:190-450(-)